MFGVYTFHMKIRVVVILFLLFSYLIPSSIHIQLKTSHPEQTMVVTLDVCHMADAPLRGGVDMSSIITTPLLPPLPLPSGDLEHESFTSLMPFDLQPEEKPPRGLL